MSMHTVARFSDLREDRATQVEIHQQKILLVRSGDHVHAFQGECPHSGAPLADGAVCAGKIICPWHKAEFAIEDGHLCEPPALDGLERYETHVEDGDVKVSDTALARTALTWRDDPRTFVVIGAGAAGTAAVSSLRDQGFGGRLLQFDPQSIAGYDRTALSKFVLAGDMEAQKTPSLLDAQTQQHQQVERITARVNRLDVGRQRLELDDGQSIAYDAALVATGGVPAGLSLPGETLAGVYRLRSRDDAQRINDSAEKAARAVVVGDSFIGMECASALRKRGLEVTVIARHAIPFEKQFGREVGQAIRKLHETNGVTFQTEGQVSGFTGQQRVEAVQLDNGQSLPADLVIVGVGVKPATAFIEGLTLSDGAGVPVDSHLQAAPGLWAAGDIAEFPLAGEPQRIEHWRLAQQHGRLAAHNMLGGDAPYVDVPFFWTQHFGKRLNYLGHADAWDSVHIEGDLPNFEFSALLCQGNQVKAVVACQRDRFTALLAERMKLPLDLVEARVLLRSSLN